MTENSVLYFIGHHHCMTKAVADSSSSLIQYFHSFFFSKYPCFPLNIHKYIHWHVVWMMSWRKHWIIHSLTANFICVLDILNKCNHVEKYKPIEEHTDRIDDQCLVFPLICSVCRTFTCAPYNENNITLWVAFFKQLSCFVEENLSLIKCSFLHLVVFWQYYA